MNNDDSTFRRVDWAGDQPQPSDDDDEHGMPLQAPRGTGLSDDDLELLKLAARALGATIETVEGEQWVVLHCADGTTLHGWNSLLFSGDSFELAVDLDLDVFQATTYREAQVVGALQRTIFEPWGDNKKAATRRAVTRAAAEIGKAMP